MGHRARLARGVLLCASIATSFWPAAASAQRGGGQSQPAEPMRFRFMGPPTNGRASAIVGVPGDTTTYYIGAASGGIWKSTDSGKTWTPIFDDQPVAAIGALAIAPSNTNIIWAGTGEAWVIRPSDVMGDGIYKSTDAGETWTKMGLDETGRIGRIVIHPTNPEIVYACALGRTTGPQEERGVFRTTDGGRTWERVLFVDADTGCSGLSMDPKDPDVLVAGTWQVVMHTWGMVSGPGSGIYMSRDGGATWKRIEHPGLPKPPVGKIDVQIAPTDPNRIYALMQTSNQGSLWRSDDGGASWQVVSWDRALIGRAGYYIRLAVSTRNADHLLVLNSSLHRSTDGGRTFTTMRGCGDCHDGWIDPKNPDHFAVTGDLTHGITTDNGRTFNSVSLPIGQMYHVAVDSRTPYWIYSNRQDDGTMRGPSHSPVPVPNVPSYAEEAAAVARLTGRGGGRGGRGGARTQEWQQGIGGCESGFTIPDPEDPDIIWATCYGNKLTRFDDKRKTARSVAPWMISLDSAPGDTKYRCHWTAPIAIDPFDHQTVYYGCQVIFRTKNAGQSWEVISPDLSTQDPSRIVSSGGVTADNLGQFYGEVVYAIAPSPIQQGLIWAGTNDGKVWYTADGGKSWNDVTRNVTGMPEWGTITQIAPSHFHPGTAYMAVDFHIMDNRDPFIYKTTDMGRTWTKISDGLPKGPLGYVLSVAENPNRRGMLFAGTGNAFHYSMDDGRTWVQFKDGLPPAPVTWIEVQKQHHDVVVSTYGRGLYILHDITRLEQADRISTEAGVQLYEPRPGFRFARNGRADFLYSLKEAGPVKFEILDGFGSVIRTFEVDGQPGDHRAIWDLRYDAPRQVELRTTPPDNPFIWDEPRFQGKTTRPVLHWGIQGAKQNGPLAAPGTYRVRMTANGRAIVHPFEVIKDPTIASSLDDLVLSTKTQIRIRDAMNEAADIANGLEIMRKQIEDQLEVQKAADVRQALEALDRKLLDVELQVLSKSDLHSDDKWFVEAFRIYMNLIWLNGAVGTGAGDEAGGADYRPTDAQVEVLALLEEQLANAKADYQAVVADDVSAFNKATAGKVPPIGPGGTE